MNDDSVMTREETFAMVYAIAGSALAGKEVPKEGFPKKKYVVPEHLEDALDAFTRLVAERFSNIGEKVTDEFEKQEIIQQKTDEMIADIVLTVRNMFDSLKRR